MGSVFHQIWKPRLSNNSPRPAASATLRHPFFLLPRELRDLIYNLLLVDSLENLTAIRSVSRDFFSDATPFYWAAFVPKVEPWESGGVREVDTWESGGVREDDPPFLDPSISPPQLMTRFKRRVIKLKSKIDDVMTPDGKTQPTVDGRGPRNIDWICKMPQDARQFVRKLGVCGPLPLSMQKPHGTPPIDAYYPSSDRDWFDPLKSVIKWTSENMEMLQSIEYYHIDPIDPPFENVTKHVHELLLCFKLKVPLRKLVISHLNNDPLSHWPDILERTLEEGSPIKEVDIWITQGLASIVMGEWLPSFGPPEDDVLLDCVARLKLIKGLDSVRVLQWMPLDDDNWLKSRLTSPIALDEIKVDIDLVEGLARMSWDRICRRSVRYENRQPERSYLRFERPGSHTRTFRLLE